MFNFLKRLFRTKSITRYLRAWLSGVIPSYWTSNPETELDANVGWTYVAVEALATNVSQATLSARIHEDRPPTVKDLHTNDHTDELPRSHPLVRLLRRPNPEQTLATFLHSVSQQLSLHGQCFLWCFRGDQPAEDAIGYIPADDCPHAMYVLPKRVLFPEPPSSEYPLGSFRITPFGTFTGPIISPEDFADPDRHPGNSYGNTIALVPGRVIDLREVKVIKLPDPANPGDALSPVTQTGLWSDIQKQIFQTQWATLHNNVNPSLILEENEEIAAAGGIRFEDREEATEQVREKHGGPDNQSNTFIVPTGRLKTVQVGRSAIELDYNNSATQNRDALLATHRVTPAAVGLMAAGGNASYYVQMQAFVDLTVQPRLNLIAGELTEVFERYYPGLEITLDAKQFNDRAQVAVRVNYLATSNLATINELRELDGLPSDPRFGHLTPAKFQALIEAGKAQSAPAKQPAPDNRTDLANRQPDEDRSGVRDPSRDVPAGSPRSNGKLVHLGNGSDN